MGLEHELDDVVLRVSAIGEDGLTWVDCEPPVWGEQIVITERARKLFGLSPTQPVIFSRRRLLELFPYVTGVSA